MNPGVLELTGEGDGIKKMIKFPEFPQGPVEGHEERCLSCAHSEIDTSISGRGARK